MGVISQPESMLIKNRYEPILEKIEQSDKRLFSFFEKKLNDQLLKNIADFLDEKSIVTYVVAITPRSGSSYFTDLLAKTQKVGQPDEYVNPEHVANICRALKVDNFSDYWIKLIKNKSSGGFFGIKSSFYQYSPFLETGLDELIFRQNKIIYLTRKNIVKQAISLYLATESKVFHTNIQHSEEKWNAIIKIPYKENIIRNWVHHIYIQEVGWEKYLKNKDFIAISYEDFEKEKQKYIQKTLDFIGVEYNGNDLNTESIFKKMSSDKNEELYNQFMSCNSNIEFLTRLHIEDFRLK